MGVRRDPIEYMHVCEEAAAWFLLVTDGPGPGPGGSAAISEPRVKTHIRQPLHWSSKVAAAFSPSSLTHTPPLPLRIFTLLFMCIFKSLKALNANIFLLSPSLLFAFFLVALCMASIKEQ